MAGPKYWRGWIVAAGLLATIGGCNSGPANSPAPAQTQPPTPPSGSRPVTSVPPDRSPVRARPGSDNPPDSSLEPPVETGSSGSDTAGANNPVFVDSGPSAPLKYRDVGTISLAISYRQSSDQLKAFLTSEEAAEEPDQAKPQMASGNVAHAPAGRFPFLMAKIESCLLLICETHDDGVRSVADDPMVWHWAITPAQNEGGNTVIIIGLYGGSSPTGPWLKVDAIPDIREKAKIESRSWFLDNWDKALSMLGALFAFLITHWFRPGGKKE